MVQKFLTREQTYSHLLMAVSDSERKIDQLKKNNEELRNRLHELQIDQSNGDGAKQEAQQVDPQIYSLNEELTNVEKEFQTLQEKYKKVNIVNDQVSGWAKRVFQKFGSLIDDPIF